MGWTDEEIKGKILHKLSRKGKFGGSHTAVEHLQEGFPGDLRGRVKEMVESLKKEGLLRGKPTSYGEQVSIVVEERTKIMEYIDAFLKK